MNQYIKGKIMFKLIETFCFEVVGVAELYHNGYGCVLHKYDPV